MLAWTAGDAAAQDAEAVHPGYDRIDLRPAGFAPYGIGGMDFLPDGSLAICTWGGHMQKLGEVHILTGVQGGGPAGVTSRRVSLGMYEPLGLKVVDGSIYVIQRTGLDRLELKADTLAALNKVAGGWPYKDAAYQWAIGLEHRDGRFYTQLGGTGSTGPARGGVLEITPAPASGNGSYHVMASGIRSVSGFAQTSAGELFTLENQGNWAPATKFLHIREGRFYGFRNYPGSENLTVTPPAVWLPYVEVGRSMTEPVFLEQGPYAGQFITGDISSNTLQRIFLEKVGGEYQGGVVYFSGGLEAGTNNLIVGPDGALYVGGCGSAGQVEGQADWHWNGRWVGLQKLKPNGNIPFEMRAVRSLADGLEIEFTQPAGAAAELTETYLAEHWTYVPTADYGGPKVGKQTLAIKSATLSPDRRKARLRIDGLLSGYVVHLKMAALTTAGGEKIWTPEVWYTLNAFGPGASTNLGGRERTHDSRAWKFMPINGGGLRIAPPASGEYRLQLTDLQGRVSWRSGSLAGETQIPAVSSRPGLRILRCESAGVKWERLVWIR